MTTGGTTGPAENREEVDSLSSHGVSKIEQIRRTGKYCRELIKKPSILEKIKEFHQGRLTKSDLEILFKKEFATLDEATQRRLGILSQDGALDTFLRENQCFEDQFFYEFNRDLKLKESAQKEMLEACIDTIHGEYVLTEEQKSKLSQYLDRESKSTLVNFLEIPKTRRLITQRALKSELISKTLEDIDFNSLHNKIANLSPGQHTRRIQDVWNTLTGGFKIGSGETIQQAFQRIQENGTEGDLSADYEVFFGDENTCISSENKKRILEFLVRSYAPTISLTELESVDQKTAKELSQIAPHDVSPETHTSDQETQDAILTFRQEAALQDRRTSLLISRIATRNLDTKTQIKVLGQLGSSRRIKEMNAFHQGKPGGISSHETQQFDDVFADTYRFSPDAVNTDDGLAEKLQVQLGNKINHLEKFAPNSVMVWRAKTADGKGNIVGYYYIEHTLGNDVENAGEIKLRFLGNNQSHDPKNPHEKGKISRSGIPRTYTGPQFFDYVGGCSDNGSIDFVDSGVDFSGPDFQKQLEQDGASFYTDTELHAELRHRHGATEIQSEEALNQDIDALLNDVDNKARESENPLERNLYPGLVFALQKDNELDTFEITHIEPPSDDGQPGMVHVWDGWGSGPDSRREMTFREFLNVIKQFKADQKTVYRMPWGKSGARFSTEQFNKIMQSEAHNGEGKHKKNKKVFIRDGKLFEYNNAGNEVEKAMVKVGGDKDLHILSIDDNTVEVSQGTFKQTKWDAKAGKFTQKPEFNGSHPYRMPLTLFWAYLQKNTYELDKEDTSVKYKAPKEGKSEMGWLNIFKHAHSLGTILHGDLWKGPWKAFEEQHHKDHAFAGKITAALAVEKLQNVPGIGSALFDYDWANLMVGDANSSFQSYLSDLVKKIDAMGSAHRARMIKKWSQLHFPDPKFMAAMFASMQIFGQLYPGDDGDSDVRNIKEGGKEWFWYNSITHTHSVPLPDGFPAHMPPHKKDDKWPTENGQELTEIQACHKLFGNFKHPLLQNLSRQYQKYMNNGHKELKDGGVDNLDQRGTMEEKLDWMMGAIMGGKPTEIFGGGAEKWLEYGYSTEITTMPYAALLFGGRDQQLLPLTQEHILKELFQSGSHVPMFAFAQSKKLGDIFRKTGVAFAYTISGSAGKELNDLVEYANHHRIHKNSKVDGQDWTKKFKNFWEKYGSQLMNKLTGMKDPMLNLMMNDSETFDELIQTASPEKKRQYHKLRENKGAISAYYDRLKDTYDSAAHAEMPRGKGFYSGDNFRFREEFFDNGYPLFWVNWGAYLEQLDPSFLSGSGEKKGDGLFNEVRGFVDAIPDMAEKMVVQDMCITKDPDKKNAIHEVCKKLYTKNVREQINPNMPSIGTSPEAAYCSVPAMILGMAPLKKISVGGTDTPDLAKYSGYYERMQKVLNKAEEMEKTDFAASIRYRTEQWKKWQSFAKNRTELEDIDAANEGSNVHSQKKSKIQLVTSQTLSDTENILRFPGKNISDSENKIAA